MRRAIAFIGFAGFGLSAAIHLVTFFGIDPMTAWPGLWIFHLVAMVALFSTFFSGHLARRSDAARAPYAAMFGATDMADAETELDKIMTGSERERLDAEKRRARRFRPRPLVVGLFCLFLYALVNFTISLSLLSGGVPEQQGDSFHLTSHGKILKDLSPSEYHWYRAYQTRLATGHWMVLLFAAGVLWMTPRRARPLTAGDEATRARR